MGSAFDVMHSGNTCSLESGVRKFDHVFRVLPKYFFYTVY